VISAASVAGVVRAAKARGRCAVVEAIMIQHGGGQQAGDRLCAFEAVLKIGPAYVQRGHAQN
jgi:hypothetical protein